jgi:hypothetical protein
VLEVKLAERGPAGQEVPALGPAFVEEQPEHTIL